jgi:hypothetical protein
MHKEGWRQGEEETQETMLNIYLVTMPNDSRVNGSGEMINISSRGMDQTKSSLMNMDE